MLGYLAIGFAALFIIAAAILPLFIEEGRDGYRDRGND